MLNEAFSCPKILIYDDLWLMDLCTPRAPLVLQQQLVDIMKVYLVHAQCLSRPGSLATYVTGMNNASDMVCFDVSWHRFEWSLLSTNFAGGHSPLAGAGGEVTLGDHRVDLLIQLVEVHHHPIIWKRNCGVITPC